jgi:hypothetical protein
MRQPTTAIPAHRQHPERRSRQHDRCVDGDGSSMVSRAADLDAMTSCKSASSGSRRVVQPRVRGFAAAQDRRLAQAICGKLDIGVKHQSFSRAHTRINS